MDVNIHVYFCFKKMKWLKNILKPGLEDELHEKNYNKCKGCVHIRSKKKRKSPQIGLQTLEWWFCRVHANYQSFKEVFFSSTVMHGWCTSLRVDSVYCRMNVILHSPLAHQDRQLGGSGSRTCICNRSSFHAIKAFSAFWKMQIHRHHLHHN